MTPEQRTIARCINSFSEGGHPYADEASIAYFTREFQIRMLRAARAVTSAPERIALLDAAEATLPPTKVAMKWDDESIGEIYDFAEWAEANAECMAEEIATVRRALPGEFFKFGGGAAPACTVRIVE